MKHIKTVLIYPARKVGDRFEYLLLKRTESRGAVWQGVTGRVEANEGIAKAARRELAEETSLDPLAVKDLQFSFSYTVKDEWRYLYSEKVEQITVHTFAALVETDQDPIMDPQEHDQWLWCDIVKAMELIDWPDNQTALQLCEKQLHSIGL